MGCKTGQEILLSNHIRHRKTCPCSVRINVVTSVSNKQPVGMLIAVVIAVDVAAAERDCLDVGPPHAVDLGYALQPQLALGKVDVLSGEPDKRPNIGRVLITLWLISNKFC